MSSTTQELRLGPEDPALLDLLRSFDLGTARAGHLPSVPLPPNSLARYDRSRECFSCKPAEPTVPFYLPQHLKLDTLGAGQASSKYEAGLQDSREIQVR